MFECYHCGCLSVIWDCDYDFEDFFYEGEGIVQTFHCTACGAQIEYMIPFDTEEDSKGDADVDKV